MTTASIDIGLLLPEGEMTETYMATERAVNTWAVLKRDLSDRSGFDHLFGDLDDATSEEIDAEMAEAIAIAIRAAEEAVRASHAKMLAALKGITERYAHLANSGDCGFWDPEDEPEVKAARAAIAEAEAQS